MKQRNIRIVLLVIFFALIGSFAIIACISTINEDIDFIATVSGISSFFVAILTVLYVYTTSKQIEVANEQLAEMKQDRIVHDQPLIEVKNEAFSIERPRFFYTPPEDKYSFQARYNFSLEIINSSQYAAVSVDVNARLLVRENDTYYALQSSTRRINILPSQRHEKISFGFAGDEITRLFESLRALQTDFLPKIEIFIYYKNLSGGCFKSKKVGHLVPKEEIENDLKLWHSKINSAYIDEKENIILLTQMKKDRKMEAWNELFEKIKSTFDRQLGDEKKIVIEFLDIPEKFLLKSISNKEFEEEILTHGFPHYVHKLPNCKHVKAKITD